MVRQGACDFVVRFGPAPDFDRLIPLQDHVVAENSWYLQLRECRIAAENQSENGQGDVFQHVGLAVGGKDWQASTSQKPCLGSVPCNY